VEETAQPRAQARPECRWGQGLESLGLDSLRVKRGEG
jgi:hypothetical protein